MVNGDSYYSTKMLLKKPLLIFVLFKQWISVAYCRVMGQDRRGTDASQVDILIKETNILVLSVFIWTTSHSMCTIISLAHGMMQKG